MFKPIESSQPGYSAAQISEDNLCIKWDSSLSEPPWDALYMERYKKAFEQARVDYEAYRRLTIELNSNFLDGVSNAD